MGHLTAFSRSTVPHPNSPYIISMTYRYFKLVGGADGDWPFDHPVQIGTILRIRLESDTLPGSAWNESTKEWVEPKWAEVGDPARGATKAPSPDDWDTLLAYIGENEHDDDWQVSCVYTQGLRALIEELRTGVPASV